MGLFDTIILEKQYRCPTCGRGIESIQVKDFYPYLNTYRVGDCISEPDDMRLVKGGLYCDSCQKFTGQHAYAAVDRGILVGTSGNMEEAKNLMGTLSIEKLLLLHRSANKKHLADVMKRNRTINYLENLCIWYGKELYKKDKSDPDRKWFLWDFEFEGIDTPLEALEAFVTREQIINALDELGENNQVILDIYYLEDIKEGAEAWSVDVYQDYINNRCGLQWTWTVISKKELELDEEEKGKRQPEWVIIVDKPFSRQVVIDTIGNWLKDRHYNFTVHFIEPEQAEGSGMYKELKKRDTEKKHGK